MVVYVVQHDNMEIEFITYESADDYASEYSLSSPVERIKAIPSLIQSNFSNGLTQEQSDSMLDLYANILVELQGENYSEAKTLLEAKSPSDFITQDIIDDWIAIVDACI
jgi:hypothetical protein